MRYDVGMLYTGVLTADFGVKTLKGRPLRFGEAKRLHPAADGAVIEGLDSF